MKREINELQDILKKAQSTGDDDSTTLNELFTWFSHYPTKEGFEYYGPGMLRSIFYSCPAFCRRNLGQLQWIFEISKLIVVSDELPFPDDVVLYNRAFCSYVSQNIAEVNELSVVSHCCDTIDAFISSERDEIDRGC